MLGEKPKLNFYISKHDKLFEDWDEHVQENDKNWLDKVFMWLTWNASVE